MRFLRFFCGLSILFIISCKEKNRDYRFVQATNSGVTFANTLTSTVDLNILNYLYFHNGAGVAASDFNNDGLIDLYFTANQNEDRLYLNAGNLNFKDITQTSGINNNTGWTTGVTIVDINNDGLKDIYVSKVSGHLDLKGHNLLYINHTKSDGTIVFEEESNNYLLDFSGLYSQATFFDYDLDGDLDAYLLGHSLYPNAYFGRGSQRSRRDSINGDKLLENIDGKFYDASAKAAIFSSRIGYGLGIAISDLNLDGYPDILVGNDFFEDDYLYINQKNGTFKEVHSTSGRLGHTSHFSMGNDIADINNDGLPDLVTVDMLPEDLATLKTSGAEYNYPIFQNQLRQGYKPQFMQNTLHLNQGDSQFAEIAFLSGIASTEWSWSPLIADFDNDGFKDIYITNGILGATNDMDFINFISNDKIQKRLGNRMTDSELPFINEIPQKKTKNYFFHNNGDLSYTNSTDEWIKSNSSLSNGSTYADLDNDGDLDVIVNNVNEKAYILENKTSQIEESFNYLKVKFKGSAQNLNGIGAKLIVYTAGDKQLYENYATRGFLSAVSSEINIGLGNNSIVDSIQVIWPTKAYQTLKSIPSNTSVSLDISDASGNFYNSNVSNSKVDRYVNEQLIDYKHADNETLEFSRNPLVPYASTNLSKSVVVGDINNDNKSDIVALGSKGKATLIFTQNNNGEFIQASYPDLEHSKLSEDIDAVIFDVNGDQLNDLIIVSGGNEIRGGDPLRPRLYVSNGSTFTYQPTSFENIEVNASSIKAVDLDNDGDLDLSITSDTVPQEFGTTPSQYLFINDGTGNFKDVTSLYSPEFKTIGNVRDIQWVDIDSNGFLDAVVVGHWMEPSLLLNDGKRLTLKNNVGLQNAKGWYNSLQVADFDNDGDLDIIAGNWGFNTRLKASSSRPITLYSQDFDSNGKLDPIVTYFYEGTETTIATKDELTKQLPQLNKKYLSYNAFAKAKFKDLLPRDKLNSADKKTVNELASLYFENLGDETFKSHQLPTLAQVSSVHDIMVDDFNEDGFLDVLLVGNDYEISTQLGRLDGSKGILLLNDKNGFFNVEEGVKFNILGASRNIEKIIISDKNYYVVGINNDTPLFLKKED